MVPAVAITVTLWRLTMPKTTHFRNPGGPLTPEPTPGVEDEGIEVDLAIKLAETS